MQSKAAQVAVQAKASQFTPKLSRWSQQMLPDAEPCRLFERPASSTFGSTPPDCEVLNVMKCTVVVDKAVQPVQCCKHLDRVKQSKGGLQGPSLARPACPWCWSKPPSGRCHASGCSRAPWAGLQAAGLAVIRFQWALNTLQASATVPTGVEFSWQNSKASAHDSKDSLDSGCQRYHVQSDANQPMSFHRTQGHA